MKAKKSKRSIEVSMYHEIPLNIEGIEFFFFFYKIVCILFTQKRSSFSKKKKSMPFDLIRRELKRILENPNPFMYISRRCLHHCHRPLVEVARLTTYEGRSSHTKL